MFSNVFIFYFRKKYIIFYQKVHVNLTRTKFEIYFNKYFNYILHLIIFIFIYIDIYFGIYVKIK